MDPELKELSAKSSSVWHVMATEEPLKLIVFIIGSILWLSFWVWAESDPHGITVDLSIVVFFAPFGIAGIWYDRISKRLESQLLLHYAKQHGLTFQAAGLIDDVYGQFFTIGYKQTVFDVITNDTDPHHERVFLYNYTIPEGKSSKIVECSVAEYDLGSPVPELLFQRLVHGSNILERAVNIGTTPTGLEEIKLEGDFNQTFRVLGRSEAEIENLQILAPDIMELLLTFPTKYNLELAGSKLLFYRQGYVATDTEIDELRKWGQTLIAKIAPITKRMNLDSHSQAASMPVSTRPMRQHRVVLVVTVMLIVLISIGIADIIRLVLTTR